jgi:hypothetical protein
LQIVNRFLLSEIEAGAGGGHVGKDRLVTGEAANHTEGYFMFI